MFVGAKESENVGGCVGKKDGENEFGDDAIVGDVEVCA